jgi:hypothetical protein
VCDETRAFTVVVLLVLFRGAGVDLSAVDCGWNRRRLSVLVDDLHQEDRMKAQPAKSFQDR